MRARDNPFRTDRLLSVRYRLQGVTWPELLDRFKSLRFRAALIGPRGSGKTTLLEDLQPKLQEKGFETTFIGLDQDHPAFDPGLVDQLAASLTARDILLFDGAEQMRPLTWHWFKWRTRGAGGLIITLHQPGRLPTLWACRTSARLLAEITADLLGTNPVRLQKLAETLFEKHRGNLRDSLRECYDLLAQIETVESGAVTAGSVDLL